MRISDVIGSKSSKDVITISPDATVRDLIRLLCRAQRRRPDRQR